MKNKICSDKIYERPWGKHKNGIIRFVYNSGSYGCEYKVLNNQIIDERLIELNSDEEEYAKEHGFIFIQ